MVKFVLSVNTCFGQDMFVRIGQTSYPMTYEHEATWCFSLDENIKKNTRYQYLLRDIDGSYKVDSPKYRYLPAMTGNWVIEDAFGLRSLSSVFETKAFAECIMRQSTVYPLPKLKNNDILYILNAPGVESWQGIRLVGNHPMLGYWIPQSGIDMQPSEHGRWFAKLPNDTYLTHAEYKFVVYNKSDGKVVKWETGENRRMPVMSGNKVISSTIRIDYDWHGSGVAIPVFSLRSSDDWGVGQFSDLKYMADWASARNLRLIQILPINDTTASGTDLDSYPYRANSVYALHPMYINVLKLGELDDAKAMKRYLAEAKRLNRLAKVDYIAVNTLKLSYIKDFFAQEYDNIVSDTSYKAYVKDNQYWLKDYAAFCCLRTIFGTDNFAQWDEYAVYDRRNVNKFCIKHQKDIEFHSFVQYQLNKQLLEAIEYVHSKGMAIKGDLPIGISARSVDAWVNPTLFNLDKQAGAPPDNFSVQGQNWGFPTYNWREMEQTQYQWWKSRFSVMDKYFDAFRIDHILGFFRIWEIPMSSVWGLLGHFNPAMPLSVSEIENYGFAFDKERLTKPYITRERLEFLFADKTDRIASQFMNRLSYDRYGFKSEFDTQRKITDCFLNNNLLSAEKDIYDKLMGLCCEVIFQEDDLQPDCYHPRINLFQTYSFSRLSGHEQWCISRIHDDYFYYRHTQQWSMEAMRKLPALLNETDMLVCGEDLGMVPACVPQVMSTLQILSLEVERMPKNSSQRYTDLSDVPYLSVCCTGTHDTSTLRSWWEEDRDNTQWYYNNVLGESGAAPQHLTSALARKIVDRHLAGNSMWAILPWQDYMACDEKHRYSQPDEERINDPSNPEHIWCWRMHISLHE